MPVAAQTRPTVAQDAKTMAALTGAEHGFDGARSVKSIRRAMWRRRLGIRGRSCCVRCPTRAVRTYRACRARSLSSDVALVSSHKHAKKSRDVPPSQAYASSVDLVAGLVAHASPTYVQRSAPILEVVITTPEVQGA